MRCILKKYTTCRYHMMYMYMYMYNEEVHVYMYMYIIKGSCYLVFHGSWLHSEAHVVISTGSLEHPHPPLLQVGGVADVFESRETWEEDVQFHSRHEARDQLVSGDGEWGGR